ncbi:hypothetical protein OAT18_03120 [Tenacibaculum sp.]|nr:hypothetical protein [Tenacibaculum sp.]
MAKHWKQFLKKDKTTDEPEKEISVSETLPKLLSEKGKEKDSLGEIAASNSNLKALLEKTIITTVNF